jgi:two-component system NarL family response regulator
MPVTISVLLVEDHQLVREALRDSLAKQPDIKVVGEADDAGTAFERARSLAPDVLVLDDSLPDMNSVEAAAKLKKQAGVDAKIVALSARADRRFVTEMLRAGVSAYVTKSSATTELLEAIHAVAAGQSYICREVVDSVLATVRDDGGKDEPSHLLSHREREVLGLVAEGARSPAIASRLHIALGTVEVHRRNIMRKLEVRTVAELTRYAIREGLVAA